MVLGLFSAKGFGQCTYTGSITSGDSTHTNSLATSGVDSTAALPQACPGIFTAANPVHYDQYQFWNSSGATQTYTVSSSASGCSTFLMGSAYKTSFSPTDLCSNYLASMGSGYSETGSYELSIENGVAFKVLVEEFDPNAYCANYTVTITPCATEGVPTASPTPSISPTPTPTPTTLTVSGRVFTPDLLGLRNAVVTLIDSQGNRRSATTSSFGVYTFTGVVSGEAYVISVTSKRYRYTARSLQITASAADVDFTGLE